MLTKCLTQRCLQESMFEGAPSSHPTPFKDRKWARYIISSLTQKLTGFFAEYIFFERAPDSRSDFPVGSSSMSELAADERPDAKRRETGRSSAPDASESSLSK